MNNSSTDDGSIVLATGWDATWVNQSLLIAPVTTGAYMALLYFMVVYSIGILIHSFYINGFKLRTIRVITDLSATATLVQVALFIKCADHCSLRESAYLMNLVGNAICSGLSQFCDNYIVFNRYAAVAYTVSNSHKYIMIILLISTTYLTWMPFYTILPWFCDINDPVVFNYFVIFAIYLLFAAYVFYDLFYTFLILRRLTGITLRTLAIKSIIHNVISICGAIAYSFWLPYGILIFSICSMTSIHFLFNWKIEKFQNNYLQKGQSVHASSNNPPNPNQARSIQVQPSRL